MPITKLTIDGKRFVLLPEADYRALKSDAVLAAASVKALRRHLDPAIAEANRHEFTPFTAEDIIQERRAARAAQPTPHHHKSTT